MRLTCGVSNDAFVVNSGLEVKFVAAAKARSTLATRIAKREISCALMDLIFGAVVQSSAAVMAIAMAIASQGSNLERAEDAEKAFDHQNTSRRRAL